MDKVAGGSGLDQKVGRALADSEAYSRVDMVAVEHRLLGSGQADHTGVDGHGSQVEGSSQRGSRDIARHGGTWPVLELGWVAERVDVHDDIINLVTNLAMAITSHPIPTTNFITTFYHVPPHDPLVLAAAAVGRRRGQLVVE